MVLRRVALAGWALALSFGCGPRPSSVDAGTSVDAGALDAGALDAGALDAGRPWNANEVSILFPLPSDGGLLLAMRTPADGGARVLLPEELFHRLGSPDSGLPRLVEGAGNRDVYPDLRVVSARIDPCFDGPSPLDGSCQRQVRLVAQALDPASISFSDAAIHLFYQLDEPRFLDTLARLRALSRATAVTGPLAPHPILSRDALAGPFSDEVRAILLSVCSSANLTRFTAMATGRSKNWFFFILDRQADGGFAQSEIPGGLTSDSFTDQGQTHYRMGIPLAVPWFPDPLLSSSQTRALGGAAFATGYDQLARLSNPRLTRTRDVSCAACHASESTQVEALSDRDAGMPPPAPSAYGPPRSSEYRLGNLHAFSFFFDVPAISERTFNETQEVLRFLGSSAFLQSLSPVDRARLE